MTKNIAKTLNSKTGMEIAIIGIACKFPGANNAEEYWENISNGVESISFYTIDELRKRGVPEVLLNNKNYVRASAVCKDIDKFDANFFGFFPREIEIMDPQHRLFLECCWQAWEDAGYTSDKYNGRVGVFGGTTMNTYLVSNVLQNPLVIENVGHLQNMIGNDKDFVTTRVSYKLNFTGPSFAVQTACSTSLVAIHIACSNLLNRECDTALAGGASIRVPQDIGYMYQSGGTSSSDGHCRPFDSKAEGSVVGNGAGIIVLKRLDDAIKDGDNIYAIIKGTAIGNDGAEKPAFSTPSSKGQAQVISDAISIANVKPSSISYIEAHGTGTIIGDPIEFNSLSTAMNSEELKLKNQYCSLGSIKANIGHLDAAAGVSGIIKVALALKHKKIPPLLHFKSPNPQIKLDQSPFYINTDLKKWEKKDSTPRRAGVNSIGLGGANAFAVLEESPKIEHNTKDRSLQVITLSAKTNSALSKIRYNLAEFVKKNKKNISLPDVAYTLQIGRKEFNHKTSFICSDVDDFLASLDSDECKVVVNNKATNFDICFMFTGQGSQYQNLARGLYKSEPIFKKYFDECLNLIKPYFKYDFSQEILGKEEHNEKNSNVNINDTIITQPLLFIVEYSIAKMLIYWGISPSIMIGHSIGEYVAACLSGVFELKDALRIVALRGQILQDTPDGKMLCAFIEEKDATQYLSDGIDIAAFNSINQIVFSGNKDSIESLSNKLKENNISFVLLNTKKAFHSYMLDLAIPKFVDQVSKVKLNKPKIKFVSNVTGELISDEMATDYKYWGEHLRSPVKFSKGVSLLRNLPSVVFIEVGPDETLLNLVKTHSNNNSIKHLYSVLGDCKDSSKEQENLLFLIKNLWLLGININWEKFHHNFRNRISLPTYPFEKKRYWLDAKEFSINGVKFMNKEKNVKKVEENVNDSISNINTDDTLSLLINQLKDLEISIKFYHKKGDSIKIKTNTEINNKEKINQQNNLTQNLAYNTNSLKEQGFMLKEIWKELLGIEKVEQDDNIFDLGAHSLLLTQMLSRIQKTFSITLSMEEIMNNPVLQDMEKLIINKMNKDNGLTDIKIPKQEETIKKDNNEIEQNLKSIWKELLGIEKVEQDDNIFDLGAHSLLLTQMLNKIQQEFVIEVRMQDLFDNPNFDKMVALIKNKKNFAPTNEAEIDNIVDEMKNMSEEDLNKLIKEIKV